MKQKDLNDSVCLDRLLFCTSDEAFKSLSRIAKRKSKVYFSNSRNTQGAIYTFGKARREGGVSIYVIATCDKNIEDKYLDTETLIIPKEWKIYNAPKKYASSWIFKFLG